MAFDKNDTQTKVTAIIAETLKIDKNSINPDSSFESLGADSLDMAEMLMKFEETFAIEIPDQEAEEITTVEHAVDKIQAVRTK